MRGRRDGSGDYHRAHLGDSAIPDSTNPKREIVLRIARLARLMHRTFDQSVGEIGVTRSQWTLIAVVARNPGATQRTIAEVLDITEAAAGRLIDRMCQEGLLERRPKPDDRRAHSIYVTDKAEPVLTGLTRLGERNEEIAFSGLSGPDLAQLQELLDRVYFNLAPDRD